MRSAGANNREYKSIFLPCPASSARGMDIGSAKQRVKHSRTLNSQCLLGAINHKDEERKDDENAFAGHSGKRKRTG